MIPPVTAWPAGIEPPEVSRHPLQAYTSRGSSEAQVPGRFPVWPHDWQQAWPLDPLVFGRTARVRAGWRDT